MLNVPQHETNKASELAFVALCLILHAHGGEITVTAEQIEEFMKLEGHQLTQKFTNDDGSITFKMETCPQHTCKEHVM